MSDLEQKFDELILRVEDSIASVDGDKLGDFKQLNQDITDACTQAQSSVPEIAKIIKPKMGTLVSRLDQLALSIASYQTRLLEKKK